MFSISGTGLIPCDIRVINFWVLKTQNKCSNIHLIVSLVEIIFLLCFVSHLYLSLPLNILLFKKLIAYTYYNNVVFFCVFHFYLSIYLGIVLNEIYPYST
uniref:Uncharacterized protein n=1 Tax=Cacopsylla melanoneura TaxID=428564 RepID=A0A8D8X2C9_9HEMI